MLSEWGSPNSKLIFLIESPTRYDIERGELYCVNDVLHDTLSRLGISKNEIRIMTIHSEPLHKHEPTIASVTYKTEAGKVIWKTKGGFVDDPSNIRNAILKSLTPDSVIFCSSNMALSLLCPSLLKGTLWKGYATKYMGSVLRADDFPVYVIPTYDPLKLRFFNTDLRIVYREQIERGLSVSEGLFSRTERHLIIRPTFNEVMDFFSHLKEQKCFFFDLEVLNSYPSAFSMSCSPDEAICVPIVEGFNSFWFSDVEQYKIFSALEELLMNPNIEKGNQNILFDLFILRRAYDISYAGPLHDPMILHSLIYPDFPKSLAFLCARYTDQPYYKGDIEGATEDADDLFIAPWLDPDTFFRYNALDACIAFEAYQRIRDQHDLTPFEHTYQRTLKLIPSLIEMMLSGVKVDVPALRVRRAALWDEILQCKNEIPFNPNSSQQCSLFFYGDESHSTDVFTLRKLSRDLTKGDMAKRILHYRKLNKLYTTYYSATLDADAHYRCSYNIRGTNTGRLSSNRTIEGHGGNMQNLPADMLNYFVID